LLFVYWSLHGFHFVDGWTLDGRVRSGFGLRLLADRLVVLIFVGLLVTFRDWRLLVVGSYSAGGSAGDSFGRNWLGLSSLWIINI
jgi:hypothetical protein